LAFGAYPQITSEQLGRLSLVDFEARRDAFRSYLAAVPAKGIALMNNAFWDKSRIGANAKIHFVGAANSDSFDISLVKYDENWENPESGILTTRPIRVKVSISYNDPGIGGGFLTESRYLYINSGFNGSNIPMNMLTYQDLLVSGIDNIDIDEIVELEPLSPVSSWSLISVSYPVATTSFSYNYSSDLSQLDTMFVLQPEI
jgi:hypothetical protein